MAALRPDLEIERLDLADGSWVDVARDCLDGATDLYEHLRDTVAWQSSKLFKYDHFVEERRLGSFWSRGRPPPHESLIDVHRWLQHRYKARFEGFGMILYRDGNDGQGFHRDTDMRWLDDTVIAILTLGGKRPWQLRPKTSKHTLAEGKGATHELLPAGGDLLVMGGRCQADWEHSVPYLMGRTSLEPRISIQWRWTSRTGRPFQGSSYGAPLNYSTRRR